MSSSTGRAPADAQSARRRLLAEEVARRGTVSVEELIDGSGASSTTVYRDLAALEEAGLIQRRWGQVSAVASGPHEAAASFRVDENVDAKREIAAWVAGTIGAGSSVMIDDSTSSVWVVRALLTTSPLTIVTNSMLVAREVGDASGVRLFVVGGTYQPWADALLGATTTRIVEGLQADVCVLSASGIANGQCYHPHDDVAAVKRAMLQAATRRYLLLDHTKLGRRALHAFARLDEFDAVVVDSRTSAADRRTLVAAGARVQVADAESCRSPAATPGQRHRIVMKKFP